MHEYCVIDLHNSFNSFKPKNSSILSSRLSSPEVWLLTNIPSLKHIGINNWLAIKHQ